MTATNNGGRLHYQVLSSSAITVTAMKGNDKERKKVRNFRDRWIIIPMNGATSKVCIHNI